MKMVIVENGEDYDSDDVIWDNRGSGYRSKKDGRLHVVRCPKCSRENYAMAVSEGSCAWCGFDPNKGVYNGK